MRTFQKDFKGYAIFEEKKSSESVITPNRMDEIDAIVNPFDDRNPDEVWAELKSKAMPISKEEFIRNMILLKLKEVYKNGSLNSVHGYLKKNKIPYEQIKVEFGLDNKQNRKEKQEWLDEPMNKTGVFRTHLYSIGIKARKTGFGYNRLRGSEIKIIIK